MRPQNGPVLGRTASSSADDTPGDTPGSCRSAAALWVRCRRDRTIRTLITMYRGKNCPFKVPLWFSPLQQVTERHTAPPAAEMPTGHTHGGTWTPAALVRALRVTGSILPLCETRKCSDVICEEPRQLRRDSNQRLTADVGRGVAAHANGLVAGPEEAGPLVRLDVAELSVVPHRHLAGAHLLQRAKTEPAQVLRPQNHQTVLTGEETSSRQLIRELVSAISLSSQQQASLFILTLKQEVSCSLHS